MVLRAQGLTIKEIAQVIDRSPQTVKAQFSFAYSRLGAMNMAEAFTALGWLRIPGEESEEEEAA